ncbi:MAG TPA: DinB family protein [Longimicrobium sp.]|nr:DinB family protein [Longimicrobium sp.]
MPSPKQQFLAAYDREHETTMRVLRAFPPEKADLQPHPKCKTAKDLAWVFVVERGLGTHVMNDAFAKGGPEGEIPQAPETYGEVLEALEHAHAEFRALVEGLSDESMNETVKFFTAPKTMGDVPRLEFLWFLVNDQIHHRGQFSIYLRMADARVPSIYGPTADEPWM